MKRGIEGAEPVYGRRRPWKALWFQARALRNPPAWALNVRIVVVGIRESRLGPGRLRGGGKRCPAYNRRTREEAWAVERQSERVVVLGGRESRPRARTSSMHGKDEKDSDECRFG